MVEYSILILIKKETTMKTINEKIKELQQIIEQTKALIKVAQYNFDDNASAKSFDKYIEALFKNRLTLIRSYGQQNKEVDLSEFNYDILTRRQQAISALAAKVQEDYQSQYPDFSVAEIFAQFCAPCPTDTFGKLDELYHVEAAAAIWILDQLRNSGKLDEALAYLPESREELDRIDLPDVTDSVHCDDLIRGMLYIIRYRNSSKAGFDSTKAFMDSADATLANSDKPDGGPARERFEAVLSLLDSDTITDLRDRFIAYTHHLTQSCLSVYDKLNEKAVYAAKTKIAMLEKEIENSKQTESAASVLNQTDGTNVTLTASDTRENAMAVEEDLQNALYLREAFYMNIMLQSGGFRHQLKDLLGDNLYAQLYRPMISDPFGMCFAFLSLLDSNSDVIWLYNLPYIILADSCLELPWASAELIRAQGDSPKPAPALIEAAKEPERYLTPPSESLLNQKLVAPPFLGISEDKISFSQLVYLFSGVVPPRGMPELSYLKALLTDSDLSENEINILYDFLTLACSLSRRDENYVFIDEDEGESEEPSENITDESLSELRELKRENKNLKAMLNKLEHRLKESAEALDHANDSLNEATAELGELRSMIREADNSEKEYSVTVTFPYSAQKRAVVFGGHLSWLKAIRPLLPNVRFVEPSAQPNAGLIMNADVIWIQTNAMSHSDFYKIIDIVRKHNIELHYFTYASAEKCAEQFALNDMGEAEDNSEKES